MNNLIRAAIEEGSEITAEVCRCKEGDEHAGCFSTCRWWRDLQDCSGHVRMFRYQIITFPSGNISKRIYHLHLCSRHGVSFASRDYIRPVYDDEDWPPEPLSAEAL